MSGKGTGKHKTGVASNPPKKSKKTEWDPPHTKAEMTQFYRALEKTPSDAPIAGLFRQLIYMQQYQISQSRFTKKETDFAAYNRVCTQDATKVFLRSKVGDEMRIRVEQVEFKKHALGTGPTKWKLCPDLLFKKLQEDSWKERALEEFIDHFDKNQNWNEACKAKARKRVNDFASNSRTQLANRYVPFFLLSSSLLVTC